MSTKNGGKRGRRGRKRKNNEKIICPRCGKPCSFVIEAQGYKWCVHYYGQKQSKKGKTNNEERHSLGPVNGAYKVGYREKKNIHLRSLDDENRFTEYVKESLNLMKQQDNFNLEKVEETLQIFKEWLQSLDNRNIEYKKIIETKINEIEQALKTKK